MRKFFIALLTPSFFKRTFLFLFADIVIIIASIYLSFLLRFDFNLSDEYKNLIYTALLTFMIIKLTAFAIFRMYKITWRYVGLNDLLNIMYAVILSESMLMVLHLNFLSSGIPRSIFIIDGIISLFLLSGLRVSKRLFLEVFQQKGQLKEGKKTIIVGAGNTGEMILRDVARQKFSQFYPVGLLDDDKNKVGAYIHNIKVIGTTDELKNTIKRYGIEAVIIAIPSLDYKTLRKIYNVAKETKVDTIKIIPRIYGQHKPEINIKGLEDIRIEDIIGRQVIEIDYKSIEAFLKDKVILITGAGGSIGSEIANQVCTFQPERVILFDIDETELHNLEIALKNSFPYLFECDGVMGKRHGLSCPPGYLDKGDKVSLVVGDINDEDRVKSVFERFRPNIVFHAAAYKHVPMMEYNPGEAVKVNIFGTYVIAKVSTNYDVEKFIFISTDKAVKPTSIMGASKRMGEYICKAFNNSNEQKDSRQYAVGSKQYEVGSKNKNQKNTEFISVRFGNVLGSRGSILPLFLEQLRHGGPLTVTHKNMRRYFMTIPESVSLVLQSSVIGKGGDILVLDMGEPVSIIEFAEELIRIHGLTPYRDIDIEFTGIRPGENLFEEILTAEEGTVTTKHKKVFIAKSNEKFSQGEIQNILGEFKIVINGSGNNYIEIKQVLKKYIKYFDKNLGIGGF
ncbi:MAG TPA: nucleoside-diphosphate sugar epimerase/dehydratase [Nitrospinota bacterium]|nr:nucleoside-diphosphate sugar epimerase/dehydratase [Nitrospinota bacterium]